MLQKIITLSGNLSKCLCQVPYRLSRTQDLEALIRPMRSSLRCVDVETCCGCRQVVKALEGLDL